MNANLILRYALIAFWLYLSTTAPAQTGDENDLCWRRSFGRGAGVVPKACAAGQANDNGLCYSDCKPGMTGVGPVCWSVCPAGFRDDGAFCAKPQSYGRGAGYALWNEQKCRDENGGKCEKNGALWYPVCKPNFHAVGCCVCSPDCPPGMKDIGVSCAKVSYGRGAGTLPQCASGQLSDAGLCYGSCPPDYDAVGPVCWGKCPPEFPFSCGAGCAKSQLHCAAGVIEMSTETLSVGANILLMVAGAPGALQSLKAGARAGADAAVRVVIQGGFRSLSQRAQIAAKKGAQDFTKALIRKTLKNVIDYRNLFGYSLKLTRWAGLKAANEAARDLATANVEGQFDYSLFTAGDPTGASALIYAFAKYGTCGLEPVIPDVADIDFGPDPVKDTDVRTISLKIQSPTTITEVTTSPLTGCAIVPEVDCLGRQLNPGETCNLRVKVSGQGSVVGEVRVYTTEYDIVPMAFGVRAKGLNGKECARPNGVDESVTMTALAGVWAWNDDNTRKVIVNQDGSVQSFRGPGKATIVDPFQRKFAITIGSSPAEIVQVADHRETLTLPSGSPAVATRRPWDPGCNPGEKMFVGLCYDLPIGFEPTSPGFMGKPCPLDWRDDGTRCYPPWNGSKVAFQADKDGTYPMRHPILVTDCAKYSQVNKQRCPANFKNTGGPAGCTCEAVPMSKQVKSIIGRAPR